MLAKCRQHQISLNLKKCIFCVPFGVLLGHIVCRHRLMVDPAKIAIIVNLPPPNSVKQLCTSLGHTGYYRKFIKDFAKISAPFTRLTKKNLTFTWDVDCDDAFQCLKRALTVLVLLDGSKPFTVYIDACGTGLAVLM